MGGCAQSAQHASRGARPSLRSDTCGNRSHPDTEEGRSQADRPRDTEINCDSDNEESGSSETSDASFEHVVTTWLRNSRDDRIFEMRAAQLRCYLLKYGRTRLEHLLGYGQHLDDPTTDGLTPLELKDELQSAGTIERSES